MALYLAEVDRFARWLLEHDRPAGAPGDLLAVSRQDAEAYLTDLREQGRKPATIGTRWIALRSLYRWCAEEDELDESPLARVKVAKPDPPPVRVLSADDYQQLLKACAGRDFIDRRDAAIIATLYATGLRIGELCALRLDDVDLVQRVVLVRHGKGDKHRFTRYDSPTAVLIDRYRRARGRHKHAQLPQLWLGRVGPLTVSGAQNMLRRRAAQAGIGHLHPHQLRHTFADRWLSGGGSEGDLQRLGGWANAEVMKRYGAVRATDRALGAYDGVMGTQ